MDDKFKVILDSLQRRQQRSKLEPYSDLIDELRRRGHTYREIMRILAEKCDLITVSSTLVRFMAARSKEKRKRPRFQGSEKDRKTVPERTVVNPAQATPDDEVWERIEALKRRPTQTITPTKQFEYDPDQPLHLRQSAGKSTSGQST